MSPSNSNRRWYSISVDTLRGSFLFLLMVSGAVVAILFWRDWQSHSIKQQAIDVVAEVRLLAQQLSADKIASNQRESYNTALESFRLAQGELEREEYRPALDHGLTSRQLLMEILEGMSSKATVGEAQFIGVNGRVEFRRGEGGEWQPARNRTLLRAGDFVRTVAGGSADVMFIDGTRYTIRPNTLVVVTRGRGPRGTPGGQAMKMEYGWVNLNTSSNSGTVSTPEAEARVEKDSEAFVTYEKETRSGRFGAYRGKVAVSWGSGETRTVNQLEEVVQEGDRISEPQALPLPPTLASPANDTEVVLEEGEDLVLRWREVASSPRYALQVSQNRNFYDNVIDVEDRDGLSATLGLRGEGTFLWRVAAFSRDGAQGPWSEERRFHVRGRVGRGEREDQTPPEVEIREVTSYGNIFIVTGATEPGASVEINSELVKVAADGSFTKTVQMVGEGWVNIEVRVRDAAGNETMKTHPVFVESP